MTNCRLTIDVTIEEVRAAIATVESSRQTHVEWRDHWLAMPCGGRCEDCTTTAIVAGGLDHQEKCIQDYNQVLDVLRNVEASIR